MWAAAIGISAGQKGLERLQAFGAGILLLLYARHQRLGSGLHRGREVLHQLRDALGGDAIGRVL